MERLLHRNDLPATAARRGGSEQDEMTQQEEGKFLEKMRDMVVQQHREFKSC